MPVNQTNSFGTDPASTTSPGGALVELALETTGVLQASKVAAISHATGLSNLLADSHSQYVHKDIARSIAAQHSFDPTSAVAPFALGANAQGQNVTGLDADTVDGSEAAALLARANHTGTQAPATISPQGAGSGLDADTLDGSEAAAFALVAHTHAAADVISGQLLLERGGTEADLSATGGPDQVVQQGVAGGALSVAQLAHSQLSALSADDHAIYALLTGRAGGQTFNGGTAPGESLTLRGSSDPTKGPVFIGTNAAVFDNGDMAIGATAMLGTERLRSALATDGDSILAVFENSQANSASSIDETAQIRFGFGGNPDVARIVAGKVGDYTVTANEDSFLAFFTDRSGTATEAMRIDENGRVGIGTTTPGTLLQVAGLTTIGSGIPPNHVILADGIFVNGNMGVGIDKLVIFGKDAVVGIQKSPHLVIHNEDRTTGNSSFIAWTSDNNTNNEIAYAAIDGIAGARTSDWFAGELAFYTRTTLTNTLDERMRIDSNGNVGIGTANPTENLEVAALAGNITIRVDAEGGGANEARLELSSGATSTKLFYRDSDDNFGIFHKAITRFRIQLDGTILLNEGGGNVGIGTTTPNGPLDLTGDSPGNVGGFAAGALQVTSPSTNPNANAVITGHNSNGGGNKQLWYLGSTSGSNDDIALINRQSASLALYTSNIARLTIDAAGNITVTGTVEGRDIATDGTKLDGIEALADVTDEANVTAALPVSDATSLVKDPVDGTKQMRIDVGAVTTATTRVLTMPDQDVDLTPTTGTFSAASHKGTHVSGGSDAFTSTDLLEAIVKRLQVTGPTTLTLGAVADGELLKRSGTTIIGTTAGTGDVVGPGVAVDNAIARFDLTSGKLIQNSGVTISDAGFTQLGTGAPNIKTKKLTGITGATEGSTTNIAHGLTLSKIIGFMVLVSADNGNSIPPGLVFAAEFEYDAFIDATNAVIRLSDTNSGNMLSNAIVVLIIHEE